MADDGVDLILDRRWLNWNLRWMQWRRCRRQSDLLSFAASGLQHAFDAISDRLTAYAQATVDRIGARDLQAPRVDRLAVGHAIERFLREWQEPPRPLRWFDDSSSARAYIQQQGAQVARAAYWPQLPLAPVFDAAWYTEGVYPGLTSEMAWLQDVEDWKDWSITTPRARDCHDSDMVEGRFARLRMWMAAVMEAEEAARRKGRVTVPAMAPLRLSDPPIRRWIPLIDAFAAGLFYYWLGPNELVCIGRPALFIADGRLHRADGPAVEWPSGQRHYFWRGIEMPSWVFERPDRLTARWIMLEPNMERRRCMIEQIGHTRFLREAQARLIGKDQYGKLWRAELGDVAPYTVVEVKNGTRELDGQRRRYFLPVPPGARSPHEAVAWTYDLTRDQYRIATRT